MSGTKTSRRSFLGLAAGAAVSFIVPSALAATRVAAPRWISLAHAHTNEKLNLVYWKDGKYDTQALRKISWLLRDYHTNAIRPIDPKLLDLLTKLSAKLDNNAPFQVISAYRTPATNAMLQREGEGVATNSLHMQAQAVDIRLPGRRLDYLHKAALSLRAGGVGYYPSANFVHVDTGHVRHW